MVEAITIPAKYIFLDVVSFTHGRSVEAQSDIVQALNSIVEAAIADNNVQRDRIIFLPTGDGICIALLNIESPFDIHLLTALSIIKGIHKHNNNTENEMRKFQARIGLNANIDNLVIDINGKQNLAGAGLNMAARVMSMADGNQILVGESVFDTLRYREKYLSSFKSFQATVKHGLRIPVYQFISVENEGLNIDVPQAFKPTQKPELKLTKLAAYYFAHAIKNRAFFLSKKGYYEAKTSAILLWFLAKDSVEKSELTEIDDPFYKTYKAGEATLEEQFDHYDSLDGMIKLEMADFISSKLLQPYSGYLEGVLEYRFIDSNGASKLKKDWPTIWDEFDLDNRV